MKRLLAIVAVVSVFVFATPLGATSWSTDQSDLYTAPGESGWGAELVQRGSVVVATIYVYDTTNVAIWYNGALSPTATPYVWTGDLYEYRGPWLGTVPFNQAAVQGRKVGTMTWFGQYVDAGTLTYTVDGVTVTKNIQRFTFAVDDFSGTYVGNVHGTATGCANPTDNGTTETPVTLNVAQNASSISLGLADTPGGNNICTFSGALGQTGQFGEASGTVSCTSGSYGTFQILEMIVGNNHLAGRIIIHDNDGCYTDGYFAAIRHRP